MTIVVPVPDGPWTVWMADDDAPDLAGGAGVFAAEGAEPGEAAYCIWPSRGKVGARTSPRAPARGTADADAARKQP